MYPMVQKISSKFKGKHHMQIKIVCTGIFSAFSYSAWNYTQNQAMFNRVLEWGSSKTRLSKAKCQSIDQAKNLTDNTHINICGESRLIQYDGSTEIKPPEHEFRIILLGATGSGKSSAGNHLLKKENGFKTSCYAKSETKKSTIRSLTFEKDSKTYKIDIIDTPAYSDTGLTKEAVDCEIRKAIGLSAPGPHAFLLCIPATSITKCYTEVLEPYKKYFKDIVDFTFVAITRYDQLESECPNSNKQEFDFAPLHALTRNITNDIIILRNNDQVDKTEDLINKIIKSMEQRKKAFASCKLSQHAEDKLQEGIIKLSEYQTIMQISRDNVKMIPSFSNHFANKRCRNFD